MICGHTLNDGDRVVIVDDLMSTGLTLCERVDKIKKLADVEVTAIVIIADLTNEEAKQKGLGPQMLEERYGAQVYSIISEKDIMNVLNRLK